jgi:glyoxylase-like metal-dependent hydrolase (beta-lactamase superfamily II)
MEAYVALRRLLGPLAFAGMTLSWIPLRAASPAKDAFQRTRSPLAERVWFIQRPVATDAPFEGNTTVFEQGDGYVVVDAGGSPVAGEHIVRLIRELGPKPVKLLVYTHYHGDHNLGAGAFLKAWPGLRILSTEATRANMTGPAMDYVKTYSASYQGMVDFGRKRLEDPAVGASERDGWKRFVEAGPSMVEGYRNLAAFPATETFTDALLLHDEKVPLEIRFLGRANTDGDAIVWAPRQRILVTGDVVVHPVPYASACFPGEWIQVLSRLKAYPFAFLVPGHGEVQRDAAYLDTLARVLGDLRSQVAPLVKEGLDLEQVRKRLDLTALRRAFVRDEDGWGRFLLAAVFTGDIVKNAYQEAKGLPIVQGGA